MFIVKKDFKHLDPIIYPKNIAEHGKLHFGCENRLYRSLIRLFEAFGLTIKKNFILSVVVLETCYWAKSQKTTI